jgi:hypothetical protein
VATDLINITINNWGKHQRKDVKKPSWFALSNRITEDPDFYSFTGDEFKAWIYILSQASQKQSDTIAANIIHVYRSSGISKDDFFSAIEKLQLIGAVTVDVTQTLRASTVDVTPHNKTRHNKTDSNVCFDLEEIYKSYPKRKGNSNKASGIAKIGKLIKTQADYDLALLAAKNYRAHCSTEKQINTQFVKMFSSFWDAHGDWKSWADKAPKNKPMSDDLLRSAIGSGASDD